MPSEIVLFHSLGKEELARIVDIMVRELNDRLADRKIGIVLTPAAKERIAAPASDHTAPLPARSVMRVDDASSGGTFRAACGSRMRGDSTAPTGT